jgi:succinate dehydrogenase / fumarate reductase iron-sulfur subunit
MSHREGEPLKFRVQRFDSARDEAPYLQEYVVPFKPGMTVLDSLFYIKENLDSTLSFRASCRMGICGSCGMLINRFPRLACHTQVEELRSSIMELRSLPNFAVVKDLVPELTPLFQKHRLVKPFLLRSDVQEVEAPTREFLQPPQELENFLQFTYCTKCGLCIAACPTTATDRLFLGPQALAQTYRYCADTRDEGERERFAVVDSAQGVWRCHLAGACSEVCPKGLDPALGIQLLKRKLILAAVRKKEKKPAPVAPSPAESKPKVPVPEFTLKRS